MRRKYIYLFIVILFLFINSLKAQEKDSLGVLDLAYLSLEDILKIKVRVSSSETIDLFETPSTVTVIDKNLIDQYSFETIADAINIVAGIDVLQSIIDRNITTSRGILQNFYANKVLILLNDVPTWQPIYGNGFINRIDIHDVERIEILKGPASVLYGSNAYSGVVNIVLNESGKTNLTNFHGSFGFPHYSEAGVDLFLSKDKSSLQISFNSGIEERAAYTFEGASGYLYNNDSVFNYQERYEHNSFTLTGGYGNHQVLYNHYYFGHSYLGAQPSYAGGAGNLVRNYSDFVNYSFNGNISEKLSLKAFLSYDFFKREFPLSADRGNLVKLSGDRRSGEVKLNYQLIDPLKLELGLALDSRYSFGHDTYDGIKDTLVNNNLLNDDPITEYSSFFQASYSLKRFSLLVGGRYTNNTYFGDNISTRVSLLYNINSNNSMKLIYGEAFRTPTMFELYFNHPTVVGNRELQPEISKSVELAYLSNKNYVYFQLLTYYALYEGLIQRITPASGPPSQYQNVNHFEGYGVEFELRYQNPGLFNSFVNYNYMKGVDEKLDNNYRYMPDHTISFGLNKEIKRIQVSANGKYYSKIEGHLNDINPQFNLDFNIGYRHKFMKSKDIYHRIAVKNITNSDMLIAEYIRQTPNINALPTSAFGTRIIYTLKVVF